MFEDKPLYYESHVTIEPLFDDDLISLKKMCEHRKFRVATLLMQKRKEDTEERSKYDSFCTGHGQDFESLKERMLSLVMEIQAYGFKVWRYKIEIIALDSRYDDSAFPLDKDNCPEKERNSKLVNK